MKKTRLFSVFAAILVMISALVMFGSTQAYAASLAKASVTLSNTSATSVKISWSKVSKAKKYTVYRSTKKSSGYKAIKTTKSRSFTSTGLTCGKTYYFKVKAINGSKNSTSSVKSIKVKPVKPTLKVSKGCTFNNLSWSKDKNATGYEIYSSSSKNGKYKKLATVKDASYKNSGLKLSTSRYYKVRAYKTVKGKKIYGSYSSVVGAKTVSAHNPSTSWKITKKATCNSTGTKTNVCSYCKKTITEVIPKSDDHVWSSSKINASKQYCAYTRKTCKVCKKSYDLDKKEHKYSSVVKSATCTAEGYTTYTCTREACGESYKDNFVGATGHTVVVDSAIEPTCTETGLSQGNHCSVCNEVLESQEVIDALGHNEEITQDNVIDSTCTKEGSYYQVIFCSRCDIELKREKKVIEKKAHSFGEWNVTKEPSCIDGEKEKICSDCELVEVATIPAIKDHTVVTDEAIEPTCTETGLTEGKHCVECNQIFVKQEIIPANGHDFETEPYDNPPTCTEPGILGRRCKVCELIFDREEVPALGHNIVVDSAVEATCTENGLTEGSHCARCNMVFVEQEEISAIGHNAVVDSAVEATCTENGLTEGSHCERCGEILVAQEIISALGHSISTRQDNFIDSTCSSKGSYYSVTYCSRCNDILSSQRVEIEKKHHAYDKYAIIDKGYRQYYCENCNEIGSIDNTCYIDLTTQTVSVPGVAVFGKSTGSTVINKLDLTPDGISNFEITGSAKDITIDVNAKVFEKDIEIKLNGVTIENQTADCFDIKNKSTDVDEFGAPIVPWVSISAKDGTVNTLKTVSGGNAIETSCKLELKGRGVLNMDTLATSISSKAKIEIKNLTLNITSKNRGIDTKNDILNNNGMIVSTDYSNIEIKPNAKITINSTDDGIRCKNMTVTALDETVGDVDSVINITAGKDGIQLEGKTGIDVYSSDITIKAEKYAFNCSSDKIKFNNGVSSAKCKGTAGFSK